MLDKSILPRCPLFSGIGHGELTQLLACLSATAQSYEKDAFVFRAEEPATHMGVVLSGGVNVIQEDVWGNRAILTHIGPGGLFGEAFSCAETEKLPVSVSATESSSILLIDCRKITATCPASCGFHARIISNMLRLLANKNIMLTRKMEHIAKRTTREKLLSFLSAQAVEAGSREVVIPYNRQELADYLCVERSALSRELSRMKEDGLLDYAKNRFRIRTDGDGVSQTR